MFRNDFKNNKSDFNNFKITSSKCANQKKLLQGQAGDGNFFFFFFPTFLLDVER